VPHLLVPSLPEGLRLFGSSAPDVGPLAVLSCSSSSSPHPHLCPRRVSRQPLLVATTFKADTEAVEQFLDLRSSIPGRSCKFGFWPTNLAHTSPHQLSSSSTPSLPAAHLCFLVTGYSHFQNHNRHATPSARTAAICLAFCAQIVSSIPPSCACPCVLAYFLRV
jgi:hypothetical protein